MKKRGPNIAASVRAKLQNLAIKRGEDFQFVLSKYAAERFLYRLGESPHRNRFVLKGAMLFALWSNSTHRPTRDLDFAGFGDEKLLLDSIRDMAEYRGIRVKLRARLEQAAIPVQIDVGFGDVIKPPAIEVEYPTLLGGSFPYIRAYPQEVVIAEKLHAMVFLAGSNSRMKDFYDLYILSQNFSFSGKILADAISATFMNRKTAIPGSPPALTLGFYKEETRANFWQGYLKRNHLSEAPEEFSAIGTRLREFLGPILDALAQNKSFDAKWTPGKQWR